MVPTLAAQVPTEHLTMNRQYLGNSGPSLKT